MTLLDEAKTALAKENRKTKAAERAAAAAQAERVSAEADRQIRTVSSFLGQREVTRLSGYYYECDGLVFSLSTDKFRYDSDDAYSEYDILHLVGVPADPRATYHPAKRFAVGQNCGFGGGDTLANIARTVTENATLAFDAKIVAPIVAPK